MKDHDEHDPLSRNSAGNMKSISRFIVINLALLVLLMTILEIDDRFAALWFCRGKCLLKIGQRKKALTAFQQALFCDTSPERALAWPIYLSEILAEMPTSLAESRREGAL